MLIREEAERLAAAVNALRPDWATSGLLTILADPRCRNRALLDVSVAFVALALDPQSRKPTRIFEHGPWWEITRPSGPSAPAIRYGAEDDCAECNGPKDGPHVDHDYRPRLPTSEWARPTPEQKELMRLAAEQAHLDKTAADEPCITPEETQ